MQVEFSIQAGTVTRRNGVLTSGEMWLKLSESEGDAIDEIALFVGVDHIMRVPVCGNGFCEVGERPYLVKHHNGTEKALLGR